MTITNKPPSLRIQLLVKLTLPLLLVVVIDTTVSFAVAQYYANLTYDRWLLDSVKSLAQQVKSHKNRVTLEIPSIAIEMFRWDDVDKTFFKVESQTTGFLLGDKNLPSQSAEVLTAQHPLFADAVFQDKPIRLVSILAPLTDNNEAVVVSVAETLNKRRDMMSEILLAVILPQILLLFITGVHIWLGIRRGLAPLDELTQVISQRSVRDLESIPEAKIPLEVRTLIQTINALLARLATSITAQRRFVENAAHQLRTPLAGLKIQAERALASNDPETVRLALKNINISADRVSHLSSQLLALARSESVSHSCAELMPLDLSQVARECCMEWAPKALGQNMELSFDAPANATINGNATLLKELLHNLLDNAIRYGNVGGQINVIIETTSSTQLVVADNGPGIAPGEADKVLERFYRIPGTRGEGCGLGLAIVKEITDLHNADIIIDRASEVTGTRIRIIFPPRSLKST